MLGYAGFWLGFEKSDLGLVSTMGAFSGSRLRSVGFGFGFNKPQLGFTKTKFAFAIPRLGVCRP
jgi:hypothetical protein